MRFENSRVAGLFTLQPEAITNSTFAVKGMTLAFPVKK